ncbi:MAG: DUF523 domain-containing protein [Nanoarchaeota archaeon]|nr:DUF523 domain-containing protein [Nanoarchaeota archaeon]
MIVVSACLAGINCNYKGESKPNEKIISLIKEGKAIPICPEQLGGLTTPRSGARILSGKGEDILDGNSELITDNGGNVTKEYIKGAEETLRILKMFDCNTVILKQGSPSCGNGKTQGGESERKLVEGDGVTISLLKRNGIKVYSEEDLEDNELFSKLKNG